MIIAEVDAPNKVAHHVEKEKWNEMHEKYRQKDTILRQRIFFGPNDQIQGFICSSKNEISC